MESNCPYHPVWVKQFVSQKTEQFASVSINLNSGPCIPPALLQTLNHCTMTYPLIEYSRIITDSRNLIAWCLPTSCFCKLKREYRYISEGYTPFPIPFNREMKPKYSKIPEPQEFIWLENHPFCYSLPMYSLVDSQLPSAM